MNAFNLAKRAKVIFGLNVRSGILLRMAKDDLNQSTFSSDWSIRDSQDG
jgi:hypothetical protein